MKIISITSLFPNCKEQNKGIFVLNRLLAMKENADLEVIAPIPYFPLVTVNRPRNIPFFETIGGINVYHPRFFTFPKYLKFLDGYFFYFSLKEHIKKIISADIIDCHFAWPDGYGAWLMAKKLKKKFSISVRGSDIFYKTKHFTLKYKIKKMLDEADIIICMSDRLKAEVEKLTKNSSIKVIVNGVNKERFHPLDQIISRKKIGIDQNAKVFLTVGNNLHIKGCFELISAFNQSKIDNKLLLIVGGKTGFNNLRQKTAGKENIKFLGIIDNKELIHYYNACDIFCLVSFSEGWPNAVMEALACGKPCIVTKESGGEIINNNTGIITTHQNLADALEKAINKQWDKDKMLHYIYNRTWDKTAEEVLAQFEKVIGNSG